MPLLIAQPSNREDPHALPSLCLRSKPQFCEGWHLARFIVKYLVGCLVIFVWFNSDDTTDRNLGFPDTAIILNIELIISMSMLYHVPSMLGSENKAAKSLRTQVHFMERQRSRREGVGGHWDLLWDKQHKSLYGLCHSGRHYSLILSQERGSWDTERFNNLPKGSILVFCQEVVCKGVF